MLTADTGRPVKRARVTVSAGGRQSRATSTDDQGRFQATDLAAGSYTVTASKNGFVDAIYGQRRPLQPGTPVEFADGQAVATVDLRLTRGGVITGRVIDEDGEALRARSSPSSATNTFAASVNSSPRAATRPTIAASIACSGCRRATTTSARATTGLAQVLGRGMQQLRHGAAEAAAGVAAFSAAPAADEPESLGYAPTYYPGVVTASEAGKLTVGPGQELAGIDFQVQLVPIATVRGFVVGADSPVSVLLAPQENGGVRARADSPRRLAGRRQLLDRQRAARPLHGGRAIGRAGRRREDRHAGRQRHRREPQRHHDRAAAGRLALGLHHRRICGHAGPDGLLDVPRRRARRLTAAIRWRARRSGQHSARARRRTAGSRSTICFRANTTFASPVRVAWTLKSVTIGRT